MVVNDIAFPAVECSIITGEAATSEEFIRYSFDESATEFGIESCVTARMCNDLSLFIT